MEEIFFKYAVNVDVILFATLPAVTCVLQVETTDSSFPCAEICFISHRPSCVKTSQMRVDERADAIDRWKRTCVSAAVSTSKATGHFSTVSLLSLSDTRR